MGAYLGKSSITKTKRLLKWAFQKAYTGEYWYKNPINDNLIILKGVTKKVDLEGNDWFLDGENIVTYTDKEIAIMIKAFENDEVLKPILHALIETGCRIQEILAIKLKDIDREKN